MEHWEIGSICTCRKFKENQAEVKVQRWEIAEQMQGTEKVSFLGMQDVKGERKRIINDLYIVFC